MELTDSRDPSVRHNRTSRGWWCGWNPPTATLRARIPSRRYRMEQKDKHFKPHVLAIPVGATVDFPNNDPIFHNVFSNYDGQIFDLSLYRPNTSNDVEYSSAPASCACFATFIQP